AFPRPPADRRSCRRRTDRRLRLDRAGRWFAEYRPSRCRSAPRFRLAPALQKERRRAPRQQETSNFGCASIKLQWPGFGAKNARSVPEWAPQLRMHARFKGSYAAKCPPAIKALPLAQPLHTIAQELVTPEVEKKGFAAMRNKNSHTSLTKAAWMLATALTVALPQAVGAETVLRIG